MNAKALIPNSLTMGNFLGGAYVCWTAAAGHDLSSGVVASVWFGAMVCDFFDGLAARMLGVDGPIGVQLDSLADVVTGGLAPAFVAYRLITDAQYPTVVFSELSPLIRILPWAISSNFRSGKIGNWKSEFNAENISNAKKMLGDSLIKLGYEDNLNWKI